MLVERLRNASNGLLRDMSEGLISLCHTNSSLKAFSAQLSGKSEAVCKAIYVVNLDRQLTKNEAWHVAYGRN